MIIRWTVAAIADTPEGMAQLVSALEDNENAVAIVAPRKQAA